MIDIEDSIPPPYNDLFGLEIWRITVWSSKILKDLDCNLLISLKHSDIYAEEEEMDQLKFELLRIRDNIKTISAKLKIDQESLLFRIENALEAIKVAKEYPNGGVCIC